jgi:hypothetical protein
MHLMQRQQLPRRPILMFVLETVECEEGLHRPTGFGYAAMIVERFLHLAT